MFPSMLKTAMKQGIYKEYRKVQYNDSNVRGLLTSADISERIFHFVETSHTIQKNSAMIMQ